MPNLFGKNWTQKQLQRYTGAPWQVGGVRRLRFAEGQEEGTEVVQFDTGTGLTFNVLPSRGLDIASAKYGGASISFDLPAGEAHPANFDPQGLGWLKTFFGGLVTTCGLTWAGAPCKDQGEALGLHGRYSHLTARHLKTGDEWTAGRRKLWVSADVRESVIFGPNLLMRRTISTELGSNTIRIEDCVRNEGFQSQPHMMIYHINIGFPVLSETTQLLANSLSVRPRDAEAEKGIDSYNTFEKPITGYKEQVFYHDIKPNAQGMCQAALVNPAFDNRKGLGVCVSFRKKELHRFGQWKMIGAGDYVCGLEPANCSVQGRDHDRDDGSLVFLKPGEEKNYLIEISVLTDNQSIDALKKKILNRV